MALLCIGGVCVPYSAIIPLCMLGFKWVFLKLHSVGMIPSFFVEWFNLKKDTATTTATSTETATSCCGDGSSCDANTTTNNNNSATRSILAKRGKRGKQSKAVSSLFTSPSIIVKEIKSEQEFDDLFLVGGKEETEHKIVVVVKFTASWCKPCHAIQPYYEAQSQKYPHCDFVLIDVDDVEEIAARYEVAMMPTFIIVEGGRCVATYRGSKETQLEAFLGTNLHDAASSYDTDNTTTGDKKEK